MVRPAAILSVCFVLAACSVAPRPRFVFGVAGEPAGWTAAGERRFATTLEGARVTVDLSGASTRVLVTVENATGRAVEVRMGAQGTAARGAIGEVLVRPLEEVVRPGGPDYAPYESMQAFGVDGGRRATFHLDDPLGREPTYGQYFVLNVEARGPGGAWQRRSLSIQAEHAEAGRPRG